MNISFQQDDHTLLTSLSGRLDSLTSPDAQTALMLQIESARKDLILDLTGLDYLSSAGLRVLLTAVTKMHGMKLGVAVVVTQPHIREILQISGFDSIAPTFESVEAARAAQP